jgi:predicted dehydrogenase
MIGIGLMGRIHTRNFAKQPDVSMVGICDPYDPRAQVGAEICGGRCQMPGLPHVADNGFDAVVVSTPDHWHALITMMACAAGKDVYVEKPLSLFVREGCWMINVMKRYKRVIQVGVQNRSGPNFQRARKFIQDGNLGQIVAVQDTYCRNLMPGFGNPPDQEPRKR